MRIITTRTVREYGIQHPKAQTALARWLLVAEHAEWHSLADIRRDFNSADYVTNGRYVFNICGNHYRLVVVIRLLPGIIYIRWFGTHAEYMKIDCSTI